MAFLHALQTSTETTTAQTADGVVRYGGHPLDTFWVCIQTGWHMVWMDHAS